MSSRTLHQVTADSALNPGGRGSVLHQVSHRDVLGSRSTVDVGAGVAAQSNASEGVILPPNSVFIPTASNKRKMKEKDRPGIPTGTVITARGVFNRLYQERMRRSSDSFDPNFPIYIEMANKIKGDIREYLYHKMELTRGTRTYTSVKKEFASQLYQLRRKLGETYPVLSTAQSGWVSNELIKEAMQRDKKSLAEANKKRAAVEKRNAAAVGHRCVATETERAPTEHGSAGGGNQRTTNEQTAIQRALTDFSHAHEQNSRAGSGGCGEEVRTCHERHQNAGENDEEVVGAVNVNVSAQSVQGKVSEAAKEPGDGNMPSSHISGSSSAIYTSRDDVEQQGREGRRISIGRKEPRKPSRRRQHIISRDISSEDEVSSEDEGESGTQDSEEVHRASPKHQPNVDGSDEVDESGTSESESDSEVYAPKRRRVTSTKLSGDKRHRWKVKPVHKSTSKQKAGKQVFRAPRPAPRLKRKQRKA